MLSQTCINTKYTKDVFCVLLNTKDDILKNLESQIVAETVCLPTFFKITYVQQKKETNSGLKQLETE